MFYAKKSFLRLSKINQLAMLSSKLLELTQKSQKSLSGNKLRSLKSLTGASIFAPVVPRSLFASQFWGDNPEKIRVKADEIAKQLKSLEDLI